MLLAASGVNALPGRLSRYLDKTKGYDGCLTAKTISDR
ncbi:hypothetical protein CCHR01_12785 [Colletotrichum chrysophilum]|uniref:Uncharacterized protein n=1 Tax=Colletotrichum chrysophilum TaxID=1836956 RepID=A0AAD9ACQ4_9PEZI|nr:hypothetical protein CCHR01_12785 [Colletotrichum chrysophilum]